MHNFDLMRARNETRHCNDIVHFNNAGSSLMPVPVSNAIHAYLQQEEAMGGYETASAQEAKLGNFYQATAKLLSCHPDEIAFVENATRAWDMAFYAFRFQPGDRILTTVAEYGSNIIAYLQQSQRYGVQVDVVPNDKYGQIDCHALENMLDERVKLISITHIPTGGGLVNPVSAVGNIARAASIPFILDACQSAGQLPLNVSEIGCDILSATGRKFLRGPRGTGFLYVRRELIESLEPPFLDNHAAELLSPSSYVIRKDAKRFENWEQNFAGKAALGVAIDYALGWDLKNIKARVYALADRLRQKLAAIDSVQLTDEGQERCGIVTFMSTHMPAPDIQTALAQHRINVSSSGPLGTIYSFRQRNLGHVVRASVHYFNTFEEIDYFCDTLTRCLQEK